MNASSINVDLGNSSLADTSGAGGKRPKFSQVSVHELNISMLEVGWIERNSLTTEQSRLTSWHVGAPTSLASTAAEL
jgi:hypothetical protein